MMSLLRSEIADAPLNSKKLQENIAKQMPDFFIPTRPKSGVNIWVKNPIVRPAS